LKFNGQTCYRFFHEMRTYDLNKVQVKVA